MIFGSQPNILTSQTLYMSTHTQSAAEGATGYGRASAFWKPSEEHWGWGKNNLPVQLQRSDKHTHVVMSIHTKT